jgi:DNA-directed RNA polymerase specialized sigma24 family protein
MSSTTYQPFPNTHWSLVRRAGTSDAAARREALTTLLTRYRPALLSYLRAVKKMRSDQADELLQDFIADQLLERRLVAKADPSRGRFRSLLLTSLNHFAVDHHRARRRRAAESLDSECLGGEPRAAAACSPEAGVEAVWARALVHDVLEAMRCECAATGRADLWAVFEGRILADIFGGAGTVPYESLAAALQLESPTQAANLLVTAKRMYARLLRMAIGEYESDPAAVEAEIADLRRILAAGNGAPAEEASHE